MSRNCFFKLVDLPETVCTVYGKYSVSEADNGNFRQETVRMWVLNGKMLVLQTSS